MVLRASVSPEKKMANHQLATCIPWLWFNTLNNRRTTVYRDILLNKDKSLLLKPAKAWSLGANRVKSPSCLSRSVKPESSIRDKKILQQREEKHSYYAVTETTKDSILSLLYVPCGF